MSTAREPLTPDEVDTLLSAELDDELESAAAELGLSPSDARAQLDATPGVDTRRAALGRARNLIATPPPLDAPAADALVAAAMEGDALAVARARRARQRRQWRVVVMSGSAAAAIALIIVVGATTRHNGAASKSAARIPTAEKLTNGAEAGTPGATAHPAASTPTRDFGDVANAQALRGPALRALDRLQNAPQSSKGVQMPTAADSNAAGAPTPTTTAAFGRAAAAGCADDPLRYDPAGVSPVLVATGRVSGQPVDILVFANAGKPVAYVVSERNCALLSTLRLG